MKKNIAAETIDALLPQTQCGLCGYGGCMPYAKAMASGDATINLCPPGGVETLSMLAKLLDQDATPYVAAMQQKQKPAMIAFIREAECIGCTKCIQACPVDAIMGSGKLMHTVIAAECTGCELCVEPCPVDCIDLIAINTAPAITSEKNHRRQRYLNREKRLKRIDEQQTTAKINDQAISQKKSYIQAALLRAQQKKGKE